MIGLTLGDILSGDEPDAESATPDDLFRDRIYHAASTYPGVELDDVLLITVADGKDLDDIGAKYGLKRTATP